MSIWGFRGRDALLRIRRSDWLALMAELGRRGRGQRESGAFLLGVRGGDRRTVTTIVYLDDLDPNCLQGGIRFDGRAFSKLWDICDAQGLVVIGDVHTHPTTWVNQSDIDAANPMVARNGHIALIVPHLATNPVTPAEVGVHRYGGADGWTTWTSADAAARLFVRRWI
jgi:proteasome lid subunit RPN8/RPN11